jgi:hypothetical protein
MKNSEFSAVGIKPYAVVDGVVDVNHGTSPEVWAVRHKWRGDDGKIRTTFVAELQTSIYGERAELLARAFAKTANSTRLISGDYDMQKAPSENLKGAFNAFDVEAFLDDYEFCHDSGDGHKPSDDERALLTDALHGALSEIEERARLAPQHRDAGLGSTR